LRSLRLAAGGAAAADEGVEKGDIPDR